MSRSPTGRSPLRAALLVAATLASVLATTASARDTWEMRVCAAPDAYPVSSRDEPGFENRIAAILADELGASLSYAWTGINQNAIRTYLHSGECDVVMGAAEGAEGVLNTVPYYRAPFIFIQPADASARIESLEDEALQGMRIAIPPNGIEQVALQAYDLGDEAVTRAPDASTSGAARVAPIVDAVLEGEADVAVVYGPYGIQHVLDRPDELVWAPVAPQLVPPLTPMYRTTTLAVRQGDDAFRDLLDTALAERWDEIQGVFETYGIPVSSVTKPFASPPRQDDRLRIGVVTPSPTGTPASTDVVGRAVRDGALYAEGLSSRTPGGAQGPELHVRPASSPTAAAARRAAERLVLVEDVPVLLGGVGEAQARALADVAEAHDVLFLNVGAVSGDLRDAAYPTTFHIEASDRTYVAAIVRRWLDAGLRRIALVHAEGEEGEDLALRARQAIEAVAGEAADVRLVEVPDRIAGYGDALDRIVEEGVEAVLVLLDPDQQEFFLSQTSAEDLDAEVAGFPFPEMQTRRFYARLAQVSGDEDLLRVALWDAGLAEGRAGELNGDFSTRTGQPMNPSAWAAYAGASLARTVAAEVGAAGTADLVARLEDPETAFRLGKGEAVRFDPLTHELVQPLYLVEIPADVRWGRTLSARIDVASPVARLEPVERPLVPAGGPE